MPTKTDQRPTYHISLPRAYEDATARWEFLDRSPVQRSMARSPTATPENEAWRRYLQEVRGCAGEQAYEIRTGRPMQVTGFDKGVDFTHPFHGEGKTMTVDVKTGNTLNLPDKMCFLDVEEVHHNTNQIYVGACCCINGDERDEDLVMFTGWAKADVVEATPRSHLPWGNQQRLSHLVELQCLRTMKNLAHIIDKGARYG